MIKFDDFRVAAQAGTDDLLVEDSPAGEHNHFEWFFLLVDVGNEQTIWASHRLRPEFVPAAGSATQLKQQIDSGTKIGFVNTAEVLWPGPKEPR